MKQYLSPLFFALCIFCWLNPAGAASGDVDTKPIRNDSNQVKLWLKQAKSLFYTNADSAMVVLKKAQQLSVSIGYATGEGTSLAMTAAYHERRGEFRLSEDFAQQAVVIFKKAGYSKGLAAAYNGLGIVQGKKGNYKAAAEFFYKALKLNEALHFEEGMRQGYGKLGVVNAMSRNFPLALFYYKKAEQITTDKGSNPYLTLMNGFGQMYAMQGDIKTAYKYFIKGVNAASDTSNQGSKALLLTNAGKAAEELGDLQKAYYYHGKALIVAQKFHQPMEEAHTLLNLASLQLREHPGQMPSRLMEANVLSKKLGDKQLLADINLTLSEVYKQHGNYKEALKAFETYNIYRDSLFTLDKKNDLANLQKDFELDKSKIEIQSLQLLNEKQRLIRNIFILLLAAILTIVLIMVYTMRKTNRLNQKLKESSLVKDKMFSILAHDLRSPITNVVQMMDSLDIEDNTIEEWRMLFQELKRHAKFSLETLDNLLQWGAAQLQGIRVRQAQIETQVLIDHNVSTLKAQADRKKITITNHCSPVTSVFADPVHFDFIIRNLVSNAIKFTHASGSIDIRCAVAADPAMVAFSVHDTGKGITTAELVTLFSQNLESTKGTENEKGTGIGLMLCKEFVEANGGKIWVESNVGQGATFFFTLCAQQAAA